MTSYHVRFWDIKKISDTARGRYRVRWAVDGREHCKSFATKALADAFLGTLKDAARDGTPFDPVTGQPAPPATARAGTVTWYEHARAYSQMKWPDLAAKSRRSAAEALTTITLALTGPRRGAPDPAVLRRALFGYAFNHATATRITPAEITRALDWIAKASLPVAALDDPDTIRAVLAACARRLDGTPAAAATARRKRAVLASALGYAVERRLLPASPLARIQWKATEVAETVDRRSVASPAQAARLLAAVRQQGPRGEHMEAFFGCLYYAALRPLGGRRAPRTRPRAARLRLGPDRPGCLQPPRRNLVDRRRRQPPGTRPQAPAAWRDPQHPHPARPGRAAPQPPQAVRDRAGRPGVRHRTRRAAQRHRLRRSLGTRPAGCADPAQQATPLARRPYDLRHAAVSLWLNAGVPATDVARRAGHGLAVLLRVYANCIDGQATAANQRISDALHHPGSR